jgi:hypothetical protein
VEHRDTLLTIAEIAVALAGFASIVSVIAQRAEESSRVADSHRLRLMLEVALRNAGFAVLPLPFLQFAPSDPMIWRAASGLYLAVALVHGVIRLKTQRAIGPRWFTNSAQFFLVATSLACLANIFGFAGANAFSLYLASLLLGLSVSGLAFLAVAASALGFAKS